MAPGAELARDLVCDDGAVAEAEYEEGMCRVVSQESPYVTRSHLTDAVR